MKMKKHGMIGEIQKVKTKQKDDYQNHLLLCLN